MPPETTARTNGLAVASLVCGLLWLFFLGSVLAIVFGHVARAGIRRSGGWQRGAGMALAGLALGYLWLALLVIGIASTAWS